jgi:hypothetical protein
MVHHNIRLYPFDTEDNDDEEVQLNDSIRVCLLSLYLSRTATDGPNRA